MRYVTFGHGHRHEINGKVLDHNCIALIEGEREDVFRVFGRQWCFEYTKEEFDLLLEAYLKYYPRGIIKVE